MRPLRRFLFPALCFALAWGAAKFVRLSSGADAAEAKAARLPPPVPAADSPRASRTEKLRADFAAARPGEWSALWHEFAAQASIIDLQEAAGQASTAGQQATTGLHAPVLPALATEELAVRAGIVSGSPGSYAAFATRDAAAAFKQARRAGNPAAQCAVLRMMTAGNPAEAASLARRLPPGRPPTEEEEYDIGRNGEADTPLGAAFSAWTRRDPQAAAAAAEKLPVKFRREALGQVVRMWAYQDGAAALRYLAGMVHADRQLSGAFRMDYILRAALLSDPAGTAKVLQEHPVLQKDFGEGGELLVVRRWYLADPQAVIEWLRSPDGKGRGAMWLIRMVTRADPAAALQLIREFPRAASPDHAGNLAVIAESDPAAADAVADELGLRAKMESQRRFAEIKADPSGACDRWLAAIAKHGAKESLDALGWTREQALQLATVASLGFPDKAAALAAVVPADLLKKDTGLRGPEQAVLTYWTALKPKRKQKPGAETAIPPDPPPPLPFAGNPAAAAEALLAGSITEADAAKAVNCWAPHDFTAAKAWVAKLPEGTVRRAAELALAQEQALNDPAAALAAAAANRFDAPPELWAQCIRRIALSGGDWKSWVAKAPASAMDDQRFTNRSLTESIEDDVKILAAIRAAVR